MIPVRWKNYSCTSVLIKIDDASGCGRERRMEGWWWTGGGQGRAEVLVSFKNHLWELCFVLLFFVFVCMYSIAHGETSICVFLLP